MTDLDFKVKQRIDDYLEFDSNILFNDPVDYAVIFGGAVRDSIADQEINDIDLLCLKNSQFAIEDRLIKEGYEYSETISIKRIHEMYKEIHCIFEPRTWIKNKKIIQLIRPSTYVNSLAKTTHKGMMIDSFYSLLSNVDLSCCGVYYDGKEIKESVNSSIIHCKYKVFAEIKNAKMYNSTRILIRKDKLEQRGWKGLTDSEIKLYDVKDKLGIIKNY